ncbi:UNVERIFIED_CONTAM: hypothetical protein GTU68_012465 [Idotea baltica]|nr:hypothetical protein [Idotea baltica]
MEIAKDVDLVYEYTARDNLVAVLTNGTAVLGLGDIGPEASKPVMEGKGVLFKKFAGIDVFDIEINARTVEEFVAVAKALEPTFGAINIEDVKAPESFEIERRMCEEMNIPVMHDDQHGTAIISAAALVNGLKLAEKEFKDVIVVVVGAGAAAIACGNLYVELGVPVENIRMFDSKGLIYKGRERVNKYKERFANLSGPMTMEEAFKGADVMLGLAQGGVVSKEMVAGMAPRPLILALANPDPEIHPDDVRAVRDDAIIATGRSDFPNQVNNALGFPYIFRGALDVRATAINEAMKVASAEAIAELAHEAVPESDYLIPKPLDPRLITRISMAVAKAAMDSGVARKPITDWDAYHEELNRRVGIGQGLTRKIINQAQDNPKRVVFGDADSFKILKAAQIVKDDGIAIPILLGSKAKIAELIETHNLDLGDTQIIDPKEEDAQREVFTKTFYEKRKRKGVTYYDAQKLMRERNYFGPMMVDAGMADAFISGITKSYPTAIRPALQTIGREEGTNVVAGMHIVRSRKGTYFFADTTVNKTPSAEDLVSISKLVHTAVSSFRIKPRIALLSYSNFGSNIDEETASVIKATKMLHEQYPDMIVDGDIQANVAMRPDILKENYPFSPLTKHGGANTFVFPNLMASNVAYKLMSEMGEADVIGPILLGMRKPVHILQLGSSVRDIVNIASIAVVDAQTKEARK